MRLPKDIFMKPSELAERHPRLYHLTEPGAWENIKKNGLLSTSYILDLFEIEGLDREKIEANRRPSAVQLDHFYYGHVVINDNIPLIEKALVNCLDDGLMPSDWFRILNARVFFWPSLEDLNRLLSARLNRTRQRDVIVVDTFSLAKAHAKRIELSPINSGATLRKAARRGLYTFTPLLKYSFSDWRKLRGRHDQIREVVVQNHVIDIANHTIEVLRYPLEK